MCAAVAFIALMLCSQTVGATSSAFQYITAIKQTANRLVALQSSTDFGWDWVVDGEPPHSASASSQNLYGVVAVGLIFAYEKTGNSTYLTAAENAANYMTSGPAASFWNNGWGYEFDYIFLTTLSAVSGISSYATYAGEAWTWQKANIGRYAYGNQYQLWDRYAYEWIGIGYYGGAAWQCSYWGLAALDMGDTTWAAQMATTIHANMTLIALPMTAPYLANNYTNDYVNMGMASALNLLATIGGYSTDVATLKSQLESNQISDGSWDFQSATVGNGESQTTAYCVIGLMAAGDSAPALKGSDWLIANQLSNGGWAGSPDEYSEIDSEAMQALFATVNLSVGGEWAPITLQVLSPLNTIEALSPWIALAFAAVASGFAASRRFLKKRL